MARYVLPVPAGPMPNTMSCCSMASRYRRWLTVFGRDAPLARLRLRALEEVLAEVDVRIGRR